MVIENLVTRRSSWFFYIRFLILLFISTSGSLSPDCDTRIIQLNNALR